MNAASGFTKRMVHRCALSYLAAGALALLAAAPAQASHRHSRTIISSGHFEVSLGRSSCRSGRSYSEREYQRGAARGQCDGFDAGYRDGLHGRCFYDEPKALPCGSSRRFQDGYQDAFIAAYRDGFDRGRCERRCSPQPRHRR